MRRRRAVMAGLVGLALVVAGCSSAEPEVSTGDGFNDNDVAFASDMIQHHAQALQMVDLTLGRSLDPELRALAEQILATQVPEIEEMSDWLQAWDQPVPETVRDHANAHSYEGMDPDSDLPGMMSNEEMVSLENAPDNDFRRAWLEMMIEHHEGAVDMAQQETESGEHGPAVALAQRIIDAQQREISIMRDLLDS